MDIITPHIGLIFWTSLVFIILLFLLGKFAWKPILASVKKREKTIEDSLAAAERAKEEISKIKSDNEVLVQQAREERDLLLKEARAVKENMIADAKKIAQEEAARVTAIAKEQIKTEKLAAITELKNQVAALSIEIAEKIINEELSSESKQRALAENLSEEINLN